MSLLTAVVVASFFAVFSFPYINYRCWYSWSRPRAVSGVALYLALSGGGGGLLGWGAALLSNARPTSNLVVNGLLYGSAGALALRADFRSGAAQRARANRGSDASFSEMRSLLGLALGWVTSMLDEATRRTAQRWFASRQDDDETRRAALQLKAHLFASSPSARVKEQFLERFAPPLEALKGSSEEAQEARFQLAAFAADYCVAQHLDKPAV